MQHQAVDQILTYATIHDLPILQIRSLSSHVITTYDLLYRSHLNIDADFIIRVGKPVISKKLNQWLTRTNAFQILVQNNDKIDVFPTPPHISYEISANDFFRSLVNEPTVNRKDWIERWQSIEAQSRKAITQHMSQRQMNQHL